MPDTAPLPIAIPGSPGNRTGHPDDGPTCGQLNVRAGDRLPGDRVATGRSRGDAWLGEDPAHEATDGSWITDDDIVAWLRGMATSAA